MDRSDKLNNSIQKALETELGESETYATSDDLRTGENPIEDVVWMVVGDCIRSNNITSNFISGSAIALGAGLNSAARDKAAEIVSLGVQIFNRVSRNENPNSIYNSDQLGQDKCQTL